MITHPNRSIALIPQRTIAGAQTRINPAVALPFGTRALAVEAKFVRAAGGTSTKVYVQTSIDGEVTWIDIMCFAFTTSSASKVSAVRLDIALAAVQTPGDGALGDDSILDGLLGDRIRVKYDVVGTYTGASHLTVAAVPN